MNLSSLARLLLAAFAGLVFSALYYGLAVGTAWRELSGLADSAAEMAMWQPLAQLARNVVVAAALAFMFQRAAVTSVGAALRLALVLWLGFQAMAVAGSVIHEQYPLALYAIHAADQLGTIVLMALCLRLRRRPQALGAAVPVGGV